MNKPKPPASTSSTATALPTRSTSNVSANDSMTYFVAQCRPGFEADLAAEIQRAAPSFHSYEAPQNAGYVVLRGSARPALPVAEFVFCRQLFSTTQAKVPLLTNDRVNPLADALAPLIASAPVQDLWVEYADTNDGKALTGAAKAITPRLTALLAERGSLSPHSDRRAHVLLLPDKSAWVGVSKIGTSAEWPMGIPRVRFPAGAPSRSTLKLAEAIHVFLGEDADRVLQADMRAVDLGAAPGGWTWQLLHRGIRVTAIDNGNLKGDLVDNAMVKHLRMDGFKYVPQVPVDWMVCDMVEQPSRIANLVARWLSEGWARYCIFNLKLPMKKRLEEVDKCKAVIADALAKQGKSYSMQVKHLYHDREEVTCYVGLQSSRSAQSRRRRAP